MGRGGVVIGLGRELNAEPNGARLLMLIGLFAFLFGAAAGAAPLAVAGLVLIFSVSGVQAAAAFSDGRASRSSRLRRRSLRCCARDAPPGRSCRPRHGSTRGRCSTR